MACVNSDGTLNPIALRVLRAVGSDAANRSAEVIGERANLPLYRARASLRELETAGFVTEVEEVFHLSDAGRARVAEPR